VGIGGPSTRGVLRSKADDSGGGHSLAQACRAQHRAFTLDPRRLTHNVNGYAGGGPDVPREAPSRRRPFISFSSGFGPARDLLSRVLEASEIFFFFLTFLRVRPGYGRIKGEPSWWVLLLWICVVNVVPLTGPHHVDQRSSKKVVQDWMCADLVAFLKCHSYSVSSHPTTLIPQPVITFQYHHPLQRPTRGNKRQPHIKEYKIL
jgi:hypothetical protein